MEKKFLDLAGLQRYNSKLKDGSFKVGAAKTADTVNSKGIKWDSSTIVPLANIPPAALERITVVADDAARLKLTTTTVQTGDTVKVTSTKKMYFVKDDTKLNSEAGYEEYVAGKVADSVAWDNITGKPSAFPPSAHDASLVKLSGQTTNPSDNGRGVDEVIEDISADMQSAFIQMNGMATELDRLHVLPYMGEIDERELPVDEEEAPNGSKVNVLYDPKNKAFVAIVLEENSYHAHWDGEPKYGSPSGIGAKPVEGQIFYNLSTNDFSAFINGDLRVIGEGAEFAYLGKRLVSLEKQVSHSTQPVPIPNSDIDALFT